MKKTLLKAITLLIVLVCSIGLCTACAGETTLDSLKNDYGIVVEGGGFKEGSTLVGRVIELTSEEGKTALEAIKDLEYNKDGEMHIFDISVLLDGVKVQPDGKVKVTLPAPSENVSNYDVFHIKDNNTAEKLVATYSNGKVSFETDSFSLFVVVEGIETPEPEEVTLTATAGEGGTVTEGYENGKKVEKGTSVTISAIPNDDYNFVGWFAGITNVSTEMRYTFIVNEDTTLVAKFEKNTEPVTTYRFICNIQGNGSIWENDENATETYRYGATLNAGTKITLTAKPDAYRQFKGWYQSDGTSLISTDATYTFELTDHTVVCAIFEEKEKYNFFAYCEQQDGGYITENGQPVEFDGGRMVAEGTQITLTAVANEDYSFLGWYYYNQNQVETLISSDATHTFTVTAPLSAYAKFEEKLSYVFLAQCETNDGGYITENGENVDFGNGRKVDPDTTITLTAVANDGYVFKGWGTRDDNWELTIISSDATHTFTVSETNVDENGRYYVQAVFEEKPNGLKLDAHNAGFTYNENGELVTTVYQIGGDSKPNAENVLVYATYPTQDDRSLTYDTDYTIDLGGLDFTKVGTYTVTYTYKADTSLKATLTVQVVEKPADGSLTEAEWNAAIAYWAKQTNIKVFERTVTSQSDDHMGPQIMIYQLAGNAYSYDGYFENEESSQTYKGKMTYLVKVGDKYYRYRWNEGEWDDDKREYVNGFWVKDDYSAKEEYESEVSSTIYTFRDSNGDKIVFSYANFTFDAETKSYKNSDGSLAIAFIFNDNKVLTKIVVTETRVYEDMDFSSTSVSTVTFGDAVVDVPTDAKCSFSTAVTAFTTTEETYGVGGCITENGTKVEYRYAYLNDGTKLTLTAVADEGYVFKHWAKNVWDIDSRGYVWITYSTDATYTVTVDGEDGTLYAVFEKVEAEE